MYYIRSNNTKNFPISISNSWNLWNHNHETNRNPHYPPRFSLSATSTPTSAIAIAVDLSDESAFAVKWAVQNYLRPGDAVILLHVRPTSVLYGADWGSITTTPTSDSDSSITSEQSQQKLEDEFDSLTTKKASDLAQPLVNANIPFKIHIVKDHDMKERLCLEVERRYYGKPRVWCLQADCEEKAREC